MSIITVFIVSHFFMIFNFMFSLIFVDFIVYFIEITSILNNENNTI